MVRRPPLSKCTVGLRCRRVGNTGMKHVKPPVEDPTATVNTVSHWPLITGSRNHIGLSFAGCPDPGVILWMRQNRPFHTAALTLMMSDRRVPLLALLRCATALLGPSTGGRPRLVRAADKFPPNWPPPMLPSERRDSMMALRCAGLEWDRTPSASARLPAGLSQGGNGACSSWVSAHQHY